MLDSPDAKVVAKWLKDAMAARKVGMADLARHCGVRPQAVYGWLKTGRITKSNLAAAAAFLDTPLPFAAAPRDVSFSVVAEEPAGHYTGAGWPFPMIDAQLLARCPRSDLNRLEGAIIATAHALGLDIVRRAT